MGYGKPKLQFGFGEAAAVGTQLYGAYQQSRDQRAGLQRAQQMLTPQVEAMGKRSDQFYGMMQDYMPGGTMGQQVRGDQISALAGQTVGMTPAQRRAVSGQIFSKTLQSIPQTYAGLAGTAQGFGSQGMSMQQQQFAGQQQLAELEGARTAINPMTTVTRGLGSIANEMYPVAQGGGKLQDGEEEGFLSKLGSLFQSPGLPKGEVYGGGEEQVISESGTPYFPKGKFLGHDVPKGAQSLIGALVSTAAMTPSSIAPGIGTIQTNKMKDNVIRKLMSSLPDEALGTAAERVAMNRNVLNFELSKGRILKDASYAKIPKYKSGKSIDVAKDFRKMTRAEKRELAALEKEFPDFDATELVGIDMEPWQSGGKLQEGKGHYYVGGEKTRNPLVAMSSQSEAIPGRTLEEAEQVHGAGTQRGLLGAALGQLLLSGLLGPGGALGGAVLGYTTGRGKKAKQIAREKLGVEKKAGGGMLRGVHHAAGGMDAGDVEVQHGEYVVNATSANKHKSTLDAINDDNNEVSMMDAVFGEKHSTYDTEKDYAEKYGPSVVQALFPSVGAIKGAYDSIKDNPEAAKYMTTDKTGFLKQGVGLSNPTDLAILAYENRDKIGEAVKKYGPSILQGIFPATGAIKGMYDSIKDNPEAGKHASTQKTGFQGGGNLQRGSMVSNILSASRQNPYDDMNRPGEKLPKPDVEGVGTEPSTKEDDVNEVATKEGWHPGKYMQKTGDWMEENIGYGEGQWAPGKFAKKGIDRIMDVYGDKSAETDIAPMSEEELAVNRMSNEQITKEGGIITDVPPDVDPKAIWSDEDEEKYFGEGTIKGMPSPQYDPKTIWSEEDEAKFFGEGKPIGMPYQYGGPTKKARYQSGGQTNVTAKNMNKYVADYSPRAQGSGMIKRMPGGSMMSSLRGK